MNTDDQIEPNHPYYDATLFTGWAVLSMASKLVFTRTITLLDHKGVKKDMKHARKLVACLLKGTL